MRFKSPNVARPFKSCSISSVPKRDGTWGTISATISTLVLTLLVVVAADISFRKFPPLLENPPRPPRYGCPLNRGLLKSDDGSLLLGAGENTNGRPPDCAAGGERLCLNPSGPLNDCGGGGLLRVSDGGGGGALRVSDGERLV